MMAVTEPGVYDIPEEDYHADPVPEGSLSSSGARMLLPPSCPAKFHHERMHPPASKDEFDFGHAAHKLVLGSGPEIVVVDAEDWKTKAAREQRGLARDKGAVPLLLADWVKAQAMAAVLREHPLASVLFRPDRGDPEQSLFWVDDDTGIWCRARLDWLPERRNDGRLIILDYKTAQSASPEHLERAVYNYGYFQQAAFYLDGAEALNLGDDPAFLFVVQEKAPPYLITVIELDTQALCIGRDLNRRALEIYRDCRESGIWPGYSSEIELISLPAWAAKRYLEEYSA